MTHFFSPLKQFIQKINPFKDNEPSSDEDVQPFLEPKQPQKFDDEPDFTHSSPEKTKHTTSYNNDGVMIWTSDDSDSVSDTNDPPVPVMHHTIFGSSDVSPHSGNSGSTQISEDYSEPVNKKVQINNTFMENSHSDTFSFNSSPGKSNLKKSTTTKKIPPPSFAKKDSSPPTSNFTYKLVQQQNSKPSSYSKDSFQEEEDSPDEDYPYPEHHIIFKRPISESKSKISSSSIKIQPSPKDSEYNQTEFQYHLVEDNSSIQSELHNSDLYISQNENDTNYFSDSISPDNNMKISPIEKMQSSTVSLQSRISAAKESLSPKRHIPNFSQIQMNITQSPMFDRAMQDTSIALKNAQNEESFLPNFSSPVQKRSLPPLSKNIEPRETFHIDGDNFQSAMINWKEGHNDFFNT